MGTLIRHARPAGLAVSIFPLPVTMVQPSFRASLVAAVGAASLHDPGLIAATWAAIALAAITMLADPEHRVASTAAANPLPENHFAMSRHRRPQAGAGQRQPIMATWDQLRRVVTCCRVARPEPGRLHGRVPHTLPPIDDEVTPSASLVMIDG